MFSCMVFSKSICCAINFSSIEPVTKSRIANPFAFASCPTATASTGTAVQVNVVYCAGSCCVRGLEDLS